MTRKRTYLLIQTLLCLLAAGYLIFTAVDIYLTGAPIKANEDVFYSIFTREKVVERIAPVRPVFLIAVGIGIAGWILGIGGDRVQVQDSEIKRNLIWARIQRPSKPMLKERRVQGVFFWGGWIAFMLCMVPILLYVLNGAHFDNAADTEADFFALLRVLVPWTAAGLGCLCLAALGREKSLLREIKAGEEQYDLDKRAGLKIQPSFSPLGKELSGRGIWIRRILLVAAVVLILAGIFNGGMWDVLKKATLICTECVGIG